MCPEMADKSVATESDFQGEIATNDCSASQIANSRETLVTEVRHGTGHNRKGQWKMVQLESLLAALVNSKVVAMKAEHRPAYLNRPKTSSAGRHHSGHHHHHRRHRTPDSRRKRSRHHEERAKCKVRQWDDGTTTLVQDAQMSDERYVTVDMEDCEHKPKKKRRKRRRNVGPILHHPVTQIKVVDPEDLPKRARWTIIITAGFLLITCMLLVGIMLRMAPVIDQMVNKQNAELMNSLNRQVTDYNDTFNHR